MAQVTDFNKSFNAWLDEHEFFSLRRERLYWDFSPEDHKMALLWLKAAYVKGLRDAAQDSCDTLRDYATAVSGLEDKITKEQGYDTAAVALMIYFTKILDDLEDEHLDNV